MTPHIDCNPEDIAKIVITAGDPNRIKKIVADYIPDAKLVSNVRGEVFYTGEYQGKRITLMSCGMGIPSMGIYSYELFKFYDVDYIIRIGTAGSYIPDLNIYDVLLATDSYSESTYAMVQNNSNSDIKISSPELNQLILNSACSLDIPVVTGRVHCSDVFYKEENKFENLVKTKNTVAVEMETFSLFHNAELLNKKAACLLTISDSLVTKEVTSAQERASKVMQMVEVVLKAITKL